MAIVKSEYNVLNPTSGQYDTHYLKTSLDQVEGSAALQQDVTILKFQIAGTTTSALKEQITQNASDIAKKADILSNIAFHNAYPRCKYLGNAITDAQNNAIKNRTYDDLFVGDYWTINGVNYRIVAIEYYTRCGDTDYNRGHIVVVPDTCLYNAQMNTSNTTSGGYAGSAMRSTNLASARSAVASAFGSHVSAHRVLICNAVDSSGPSGWAWYDSAGVELMNEVQVYGTRAWGSALKGYDVGTQKFQFPLFAVAPQYVNTRETYWLQDVSSYWVSGNFARVYADGGANDYGASTSRGVRPAITLSYI